MNLQPANLNELKVILSNAERSGGKVGAFDLSAFNRLLEHKAEDMTATVQAGMTLTALQKQLAQRGQWLPMDPPNADRLTIAELLATDVSGPRRFGYGTVRDYVIGLSVMLADGRLIHSGGKVVKNVAGYDLMKLFIGSHGALGVIVEVTFKLRPLPETEQFVELVCNSLEDADRVIEQVLRSDLQPIALDLHNLSTNAPGTSVIIAAFAGTREEVEWQVGKAVELGFEKCAAVQVDELMPISQSFQKVSVLPSKMVETIRSLGKASYVARAGNGIIFHNGTYNEKFSSGLRHIAQKVKAEFDPKNILPELSA